MSDNTTTIRKLLLATLRPVPLSQERKQKMEETLDPRRINISRTYSITYAHVGMVKKITDELSSREGKNLSEGEIVRRAVDLLFAATFGEPLPEPA